MLLLLVRVSVLVLAPVLVGRGRTWVPALGQVLAPVLGRLVPELGSGLELG